MSERSWTIRDYSDGDEAAIVPMFERVFGRPMGRTEGADHWQWEYGRNPTGPRTIELVWDGDTLAGHYAVSPRRIRCGGEDGLAALSLDTMTHPDYGRQGIFTASAEACYAAMAKRGFWFVYGFPNSQSVGGFERRLGWTLVMKTPVHVKPLDVGRFVADKVQRPRLGPWLSLASRAITRGPGLLSRARSRAGSRVGIQVNACTGFDTWADDLWARCRDQHRLWVVRDRAYLQWRYDERPESDYVVLRAEAAGLVVGFAVLATAAREQGRTCFVMDLVVDPSMRTVLPTLLAAVEAQARRQNCAFISAMVPAGSRYRAEFLRHAYLPLPDRLFPQELHFGGRTMEGVDVPELTEPRAWFLSWGDVDVL